MFPRDTGSSVFPNFPTTTTSSSQPAQRPSMPRYNYNVQSRQPVTPGSSPFPFPWLGAPTGYPTTNIANAQPQINPNLPSTNMRDPATGQPVSVIIPRPMSSARYPTTTQQQQNSSADFAVVPSVRFYPPYPFNPNSLRPLPPSHLTAPTQFPRPATIGDLQREIASHQPRPQPASTSPTPNRPEPTAAAERTTETTAQQPQRRTQSELGESNSNEGNPKRTK